MKVYPLAPNGIFWTIQGEGALRGIPMVFVRLAGCSVGCPGCDTDYSVAERVAVDVMLSRILAVQKRPPRNEQPAWVWITGGEPTDHDLGPLIDGLHAIRCSVALATSGVRAVEHRRQIGFLSVSPHSADRWVQRNGTELKVVPLLNGFRIEDTLADARNFDYRYIQPLADTHGAISSSLEYCCQWVLQHPDWMLTDQGHKQWNLP